MREQMQAFWRFRGMQGYGGVFMISYIVVLMLVRVGIFNMIMAIFLEHAMTAALRRKQKELADSDIETEKKLKRMVAQLATDTSVS